MSPPKDLQRYTEAEEGAPPASVLQSYTPPSNVRRCRSGHCGQPAVPNRHLCHACLELRRDRYWQAVRDGRCIRCLKVPAEDGHRRCARCAEMTRQESAARYQRTKQKGICTYCRHQRALPHRELCFDCFKKHASLRRARRQRDQDEWLTWLLVVVLWAESQQSPAVVSQSA